MVLTFLNGDGQHFRNRDGSPVRRVVMLQPGQSTFLDLDADDLQFPPGPSRFQLRAVVTAQPPPVGENPPPVGDRIVPSVEVFNSSNGKTVVFIGNPGVVRGFNPQPDPPLPSASGAQCGRGRSTRKRWSWSRANFEPRPNEKHEMRAAPSLRSVI